MLTTHATRIELFLPSIIRVHQLPTTHTQDAERPSFLPALSFPQQATIRQAREALSQIPENDSIYYLFVTDSAEKLMGVVSLRQLFLARETAHLFDIMDRRVPTLSYRATLAEQAHLFAETGWVALPVVDELGRLVGALDTCDLIQALEQRYAADMQHLAGVSGDETPATPARNALGYRLFWQLNTLVGLLLLAWLVSTLLGPLLTGSLVLVAFLPLLLRLSAQAGTQALTVQVRALLTGGAQPAHALPLLRRELRIGLTNALLTGSLAGGIIWLWQGSALMGLIVGGALAVSTLLATLIGSGVPLLCKATRINPARVSTAAVTALSDVSSVLLLLGAGLLAGLSGAL